MSRLTALFRRMMFAPAAVSPEPCPQVTRVISGRVCCVQLDGYRMYVDMTDELVGAEIAKGLYEQHVTRAITAALGPGATFLDLGANIGYYSLLAASLVGPGGQVIGFEARPDNVAMAQLSIRENGFRNVRLHALAVADEDTTLKMLAPDHTSLSEVVDAAAVTTDEYVAIPTVALDAMLADLERVDVVKMDIDGGELRALRGMQQLLRRYRPTLFFEFSPYTLRRFGACEPEALLAEVVATGYRLQAIPASGEPVPLAAIGDVVAYQKSLGNPLAHVDLVGYWD